MTICYFGDYDPGYARNRVLLHGLRLSGATIVECRTSHRGFQKYFDLILEYKRLRSKHSFDLVCVGYSDSRLTVLLARILFRGSVVWDAFYSLYDAWVWDRQLVSRFDPRALLYWCVEWIAVRASNLVLLDTDAHIKYFQEQFGCHRDHYYKAWIGADDRIFSFQPYIQSELFLVLFWGKFIPLQGVDVIIRAADYLQSESRIRFQLIGDGQTQRRAKELARELGISNLVFIDPVEATTLPEYIKKADLCLGIFGRSAKTQRVIPNKLYEAAAMGRAIVSGDTPAVRELFTPGLDIFVCPVNDPRALANTIQSLSKDEALCQNLGIRAHDTFVTKTTPAIIGRDLLQKLHETALI